jgi:hypothetical protein
MVVHPDSTRAETGRGRRIMFKANLGPVKTKTKTKKHHHQEDTKTHKKKTLLSLFKLAHLADIFSKINRVSLCLQGKQ